MKTMTTKDYIKYFVVCPILAILLGISTFGCSLFNSKTAYYMNGEDVPILEISAPRYGVYKFKKSPDGTLEAEADTTGGGDKADKIIEILGLKYTSDIIDNNDD